MTISTQTEALVEFYNQKIKLDTKQIVQVEIIEAGYEIKTGIEENDKIKVYGPQELINNYNIPIEKLDNKILEYNNQISNLQQQVLILGQQANSVGCGTTSLNAVIVYQDILNYVGYGFSAPNPFQTFSGVMNSVTAGLGTATIVGLSSIGSYDNDIGTCYESLFGCSAGVCSGYATSITNLNNQITNLKALRDPLIEKVNILKNGRADFELQQYAYTQSKSKLNGQIQKTESIINFLQDPANSEWL